MATPILMPRQGQSVESCVLVDWLVAAGQSVKAGTPIASIETDKAVFEIESPADGTVLELFFKKGDDIPVLTTIAAIGATGEDIASLRPSGAPSSPAPRSSSPAASSAPSTLDPRPFPSFASSSGISPRARTIAANTGIDAASLAGSGPGGRVIARDVQAAAAGSARLSSVARAAMQAGGLSAPATGSGPGGLVVASDLVAAGSLAPAASVGGATEIPLTGIRKIIAERMRKSLASTAQLTLFRSFDATALLDARLKVKTEGEKRGLPNITLNDMIVYAVAQALLKHPELNAHCLTDRILRFPNANIGVATDTPRGLMVPVLRDAHALSLADIARQLKPILTAAQAGNISPDQLKGGTFTITNMGMLGVESFTPILNAPEVAILGVGGLNLKPVDRDGTIKHVQSIVLSLTIDHQAVDGAPGARFLETLVGTLETFVLVV